MVGDIITYDSYGAEKKLGTVQIVEDLQYTTDGTNPPAAVPISQAASGFVIDCAQARFDLLAGEAHEAHERY